MSEPQIWVLIGAFATVVFALVGLLLSVTTRTFTMANRTFSVELSRVEAVLTTRMDALETNFSARFESLGHRVDGLDRDVSAITRHLMGDKE